MMKHLAGIGKLQESGQAGEAGREALVGLDPDGVGRAKAALCGSWGSHQGLFRVDPGRGKSLQGEGCRAMVVPGGGGAHMLGSYQGFDAGYAAQQGEGRGTGGEKERELYGADLSGPDLYLDLLHRTLGRAGAELLGQQGGEGT
jgi:hypothetical protein